MLRAYGGTVPDAQPLGEIGLAIAVHRRGRGQGTESLGRSWAAYRPVGLVAPPS